MVTSFGSSPRWLSDACARSCSLPAFHAPMQAFAPDACWFGLSLGAAAVARVGVGAAAAGQGRGDEEREIVPF